MNQFSLTLITIFAGLLFFGILMPAAARGDIARGLLKFFKNVNAELGGYVHDTAMAQFISPTLFHVATGTWTTVAGQVAGTISRHKAANAETTVVNIPIVIPSNSVSGKGGYLKSIEIDYEITAADATSITPLIHLVTRAVETAAMAAPAAQTFTQSPTLAASKTQDQHKLVLTITTPFWIDNDQYVLVELSCVCAAQTVLDFYAAVANYTLRA